MKTLRSALILAAFLAPIAIYPYVAHAGVPEHAGRAEKQERMLELRETKGDTGRPWAGGIFNESGPPPWAGND
jgi:hypothetical protein